MKKEGCSTQGSHVITHRSTNWACRCLTSQIGRDGVLSPEYGRIRYARVVTSRAFGGMARPRQTAIAAGLEPATVGSEVQRSSIEPRDLQQYALRGLDGTATGNGHGEGSCSSVGRASLR